MKVAMKIRTNAVVFYEEMIRSAKEPREPYNISEMKVGRQMRAHHPDQRIQG
jgi:hypothetical protein